MPRPARYDRRGPSPPTLSIIIPTFNEAENLPILVARLGDAVADFDYEIIVVDDNSPDGTWQVAESLAAAERRLRVIRRIGRRGLSSAVLEGMAAAAGRVLAVIDADLQHDERALPDIVAPVLDGDADICLGSRAASGGSYGDLGLGRRLISWLGATIARRLSGAAVSDPMSGYFAVSRQRFDQVVEEVNPRGFKILLELLARGPQARVSEVGYRFRRREHGETKLTSSVVVAYLLAVTELLLGRYASNRFITYASIALAAMSARLTMTIATEATGLGAPGELLAIEIATVAELVLHDRITFATSGPRRRLLGPFVRFHLVAGYSLLSQVGLRNLIDRHLLPTSGALGAAMLLLMAAVLVISTVVAAYIINRSITWPRAGASPGPAEPALAAPVLAHHSLPGPEPQGTGRAQTSPPMTKSTSSEISATARR